MKFRVNREVLAEAIAWTARTLPTRPAVPILAGVHLTAENGTLLISSFDYEVSTRSEISAEIMEPGKTLVSGKLLADITKSLPNKPVLVVLDGSRLVITCGASRFTLLTMPQDEYPELPNIPEVVGQIDAATLTKAVNQAGIAASHDETLPLLTGIKIEISGEKITLLSTDRYRLAMTEFLWAPTNPAIETTALVKAKTLADVAKTTSSAGDVSIAFPPEDSAKTGTIIAFSAGGRQTTSLLMDGDYPPVRRLFPDKTEVHAVLEREQLMAAVRRVSLVAERNTPIRLSFQSDNLILEAGQGEDAQASEQIQTQLHGEEISTAFNPTYLNDGLSVLDTDYVKIAFTHPSKPAVVTGQKEIDGKEVTNFRYLLMPIRFGI